MRHEDIGGIQDLYFFELSAGSVALTINHRPSPMGGQPSDLPAVRRADDDARRADVTRRASRSLRPVAEPEDRRLP